MNKTTNKTIVRVACVCALLLLTSGCGVGPRYLSGEMSTSITPPITASDPRTITVTAIGSASGVPESVILTMGVETFAATTGDALDTISTKSTELTDYLLGAGVTADNLQTTNLSVYPTYDYSEPGKPSPISGYQASVMVTALVDGVDLAATIVDGAAAAVGDALRIYGLSWAVNDRASVIAEARVDAVAQAKTQAEQLATAAGLRLGEIVSINESSPDVSYPFPGAAEDGASLNPGTQVMQVSVTVVFSAT